MSPRIPIFTRFLNRTTFMFALALAAGLLAAWAARQHIQGKVLWIESQSRVREVERIVASRNLPAGTRIEMEHLAYRKFPAALVSSDSLAAEQYTELEGQVLRTALAAGDALLPVHIQKQEYRAFSSRLLNGRRAITMPVDEINSVSGLLTPGDLIDLYVSFEYQRRRITAPLLQGVLVLATGRSTQLDPNNDHHAYSDGHFATVTLDAAPEDAVKLVAARQGGTITAVLRNPNDALPSAKASRGDIASLLGVNVPSAATERRAQVLYGNTTPRSVSRLQTGPVRASQETGVFDLPYMPRLSHPWLQAVQDQEINTMANYPFAAEVP